MLHLRLEGAWGGPWGKEQGPAKLIVGIRGERGVSAWVANPLTPGRGGGRGWVRENALKLAGDRLTGHVRFGQVVGPAPLAVELDATLRGTALAGKYRVRVEDAKSAYGFRNAPETGGDCSGNVMRGRDAVYCYDLRAERKVNH